MTDGDIEGGTMDVLSFGVSWWPSPIASVTVNYRDITLDRFGVTGHAKGLMARILLILE